MYIVFDTETTGLPKDWKAPVSQVDNWPRLVQLGWMLFNADKELVSEANLIVQPNGFTIPLQASKIHGITQERALSEGQPVGVVLAQFRAALDAAQVVVAHNLDYDEKVMGAEFIRASLPDLLAGKQKLCTKTAATNYCQLPGKYGYKWPTLDELHRKLFGGGFEDAHNALGDVRATARCYFELKVRGVM
jgi:DNA polymerase III subunit epsilon